MKKAQVTMFIILGIVLITIVVGSFFLKDTVSKSLNEAKIAKSVALQEQSKEIGNLVENCLNSITEDAILEIMAQGGYYEIEEPISYEFYSIPLYYNQAEEKVPSLNDVEDAIASYISNSIRICADNFDSLQFTAIPAQEMNLDVDISKEVLIGLEWKITIGDEDKAIVSEFSAIIEKDLKTIYDKSIELYEKQKKEQLISLVDLATLAMSKDYTLDFDFIDNTILYILTFEDVKINQEPITYSFAIKLKETESLTYDGEDFSEFFILADNISDSQYGDSSDNYDIPEEEEYQEEVDDFEF